MMSEARSKEARTRVIVQSQNPVTGYVTTEHQEHFLHSAGPMLLELIQMLFSVDLGTLLCIMYCYALFASYFGPGAFP